LHPVGVSPSGPTGSLRVAIVPGQKDIHPHGTPPKNNS
jgi:hypothetical protein